MRSTGWRKDAQQELARAAAAADGYVDLLGKAVTAAQQANTVLGEAANLRAKALAEAAALVVEAGTMVRLRASSDFEAAIPLDRHVDAGFPAPAQDIRLGLEYDQESPPRVGLVHKGGLGERLGLEPGDRLLAVADNAISSGWGFMQSLRKTSGQTVRLVVERGRKKRTLEAKVPAVLPQ
jgi:hypothetical protein